MANKTVDARQVTPPTRVPEQRSFAPAADKPPLFPLSRVEIGRFTVRTATSRSKADEAVAAAAEEILAGIVAATDLLEQFSFFEAKCPKYLNRSPGVCTLCTHHAEAALNTSPTVQQWPVRRLAGDSESVLGFPLRRVSL
jgi:hypothetical protein